jgi:catalase-peroxidase
MLTSDLALRFDPIYEPIARRFLANPDQLADAFARAWFKLIHRDMGPLSRYLGPEMPNEELLWQDPIPEATHPLIDSNDAAALKSKVLASGLSVSNWCPPPGPRHRPSVVPTSAAAPTAACVWPRRRTGRPISRSNWQGAENARGHPERVQRRPSGKKVSLADLIVLAGNAGVEQAAKTPGTRCRCRSIRAEPMRLRSRPMSSRSVPRTDRRWLPQLQQRQIHRFRRSTADRQGATADPHRPGNDRAGRRPAGAGRQRRAKSAWRVHHAPETLSNDFFTNLLDMGVEWKPTSPAADEFEGRDRKTGSVKWTATRVDLVFGSNASCARWPRCMRVRREGAVREGLRGGLGQGDGAGSV